jgi:hypothetical protein
MASHHPRARSDSNCKQTAYWMIASDLTTGHRRATGSDAVFHIRTDLIKDAYE